MHVLPRFHTYITYMFYGNSPQVPNDIMSNLKVAQRVAHSPFKMRPKFESWQGHRVSIGAGMFQ